MNRILSFQGGMAVGKTTLINWLEKQIDDVCFTYENPYPIVEKRKNMNLDLYTQDGFIENQRLFIEAEIKRYKNFPDERVILDRGSEDIEFYTLYFPIANGFNWDIEQLLKDELEELRCHRSNFIVYLDASEDTLRKRKQSDHDRRRNAFNNNMKLYTFEKDWYEQFNTKFVDVNHKTSEQVGEWTLEFLKKINFL